jgi:hypothetical protein
MAVTARKDGGMTQPVQDIGPMEAQPPIKKPWLRMEGESSLWYNRFTRYRKLGVKRSILAAIAQERSHIQAMKSTKTKGNPRVETVETVGLHEVPRPKPQVPGSWKNAAVHWRWKERAGSWDEFVLDSAVEKHIGDILTHAAIGLERVHFLKELLEKVSSTFNANRANMTYDQEVAFIARMQSILRDIREEMRMYDEPLTRVMLRRVVSTVYASATPEELKVGVFTEKRTQ